MKRSEGFAALFFFLCGACLFTWPLVNQLKNVYMGAGGELGGWLWRFWWYGESIRALFIAHAPLPYIVQYVLSAGCYPEAGNVVDLYLFSWPLTALAGNPVAYNLKGILVLALNGLAGYLLAKGLGLSRNICLACGALFAFNTYTAWTLAEGRIRQGILCFLPMYMLFLFRAMKDGGRRNWIGAGVFLGLHSLIYWFYGLFALILTAVFLIVHRVALREEPLPRGFARGLILAGLVALLISLPFLTPYIRQVAKNEPLAEVKWFIDFPEPDEPMTNPQRVALMNSRSFDWVVNPGHRHSFPLILVILACLPLFVRSERRRALPWIAVLLFFYVMSLGPFLTAGQGEQLVRLAGKPVVLPFAFFYKYFPLFSRIFNPFHFASIVMICLVVLAARGLGVMEERLKLHGWRAAILWPIVAIVYFAPMARLGQVPVPVVKMDTPAFYRGLAEESFCGIVEMPLGASSDLIHYYQITHRKKILRGWADGALPDGFPRCDLQEYFTMDDHRDNPFTRWLDEVSKGNTAPVQGLEEGMRKLKERRYRYLLVHEHGCAMQEPARGAQLFDSMCRAVERVMGKPDLTSESVCEFRPDPESRRLPTKGTLTAYRVAVFRF